MPRSVRLLAKRKLDECRNHTSWINTHLSWLFEQYEKEKPEWAQRFVLAGQLNQTLDDLLQKLNEEL